MRRSGPVSEAPFWAYATLSHSRRAPPSAEGVERRGGEPPPPLQGGYNWAAQSGPAKSMGFLFFDQGPGGSGGPREAHLSYPWALPGHPGGGPRDIRQTKAKNLET